MTLVIGGLLVDVLFMPPRGGLGLEGAPQWIALSLFYLSSAVIILLARRLRASRADLQRQSEQLKIADRRKDEFLAMLAHELRNPLAPIMSAAQAVRLGSTAAGTLPAAAAS